MLMPIRGVFFVSSRSLGDDFSHQSIGIFGAKEKSLPRAALRWSLSFRLCMIVFPRETVWLSLFLLPLWISPRGACDAACRRRDLPRICRRLIYLNGA
jgi:hypothetical protein